MTLPRLAFLRNPLAILTALALVLPLALPVSAQNGQAPSAAQSGPSVPNEVLVQFKDGIGEAEKILARVQGNARLKEKLATIGRSGKGDLELLTVSRPVQEVIAALQSHPAVVFAEPNFVYTHQATSNDPYYTNGSLWGMYGDATSPTNQYGSQAGESWAAGYTGSSSVYVGIIDEGYQYTHPDLTGNVGTNPGETGGGKETNGIDDDGNGLIDDVYGWDYFEGNSSVYDGTGDDHGTHVAGTIGAKGGNSSGVAGVNWTVKLLGCKFLGPSGGSTSNAIKCVDYYTDLKTRHGLNIVATSNSWGGGGFSQGLFDAIDRANQQNILFVAAAGNNNSNNETTPFYPANYTNANVIAVAAIDSAGNRSSFSNYGSSTVDIGAPGTSINSTVPTSSYASYSGTSMATPHVSGAAALYASANGSATAAQIKSAILNSALATPSLSGLVVTGGRLCLPCMLGAAPPPPPTPPAAPTGLGATPFSSSQINLSWTDNASDETGFSIERCQGVGCSNFAQITTVGANVTSLQNTGLTASTSYSYRVRAYKGSPAVYSDYAGPSSAATSAASTSLAAPTNVTATAVSGSQINLTWTESAPDEDGYDLYRCSGNGCTPTSKIATLGPNVSNFSNTGLSGGTSYSYRLRGYRGCGDDCTQNGSYSSIATATTLTPPPPVTPAAPTNLATQILSTSQIKLTWQHDSANTTLFRIQRCKGSGCTSFSNLTTVNPGTTTYTNTGLKKNNYYSYRIRAENGSVSSSYSGTATGYTSTSGGGSPPPPPVNDE